LPVLDHHECIRTVSLVLRVPRVLRLVRYDRAPRSVVRLSSRNVMVRDRFQCQYCGAVLSPQALSIDHVIPRSQRGPATWENLVACCHPCNLRKGGRTPDQAGMALLRAPVRPRSHGLQDLFGVGPQRFEEWKPFLRTV
jgi:5-methylcytosine-specific restriction endonuclease McrA